MEEWIIKVAERPIFSTPPILLAAWPGMGQVGSMVVDYLHQKLMAKSFAQMESADIMPDVVLVKEGIAHFPEGPANRFFFWSNPGLIIFEAGIQIHGVLGFKMVNAVLQFSRQYGVKEVYTFAALAQQMNHNDPSEVFCAASNQNMLLSLQQQGLRAVQDGYVGGLNGLLLGMAEAQGMQAACLLGSIPSYAANLAYPKAAAGILNVIKSFIHIEFDVTEMENNAEAMDKMFGEAEDRIKQLFSGTEEKGEEFSDIKEEKVPQYVLDKIEQLFRDVTKDHSKARELKAELDRWNLYDLYENRFLDLFKRKGGAEGQ